MVRSDHQQSESSLQAADTVPRGIEWGMVRGVSMRLTYFNPDHCRVPLDRLRSFLRSREASSAGGATLARRLVDPIRSMHEDLVTPPFAVEAKLPLVMFCEASDANELDGPAALGLRQVSIEIKPTVEMDWEGQTSTIRFDDKSRLIEATLIDSICIFENGTLAYCVSFVFDPLDERGMSFPGTALVVLGSAWGESAGTWLTENPVTIGLPGGVRATLEKFLDARLQGLRATGNSILNVLDRSDEQPQSGFSDLCTMIETFFAHGAPQKPISIGLEVIGSSLHSEILEYAADAEKRQVKDDERSKALAGLIQNVFDYRNQDVEEVNDSLSSKAVNHPDISFASRGVAIRFCAESRPYREKRFQVGGSPYWMLVELIAGHNKVLLHRMLETEIRFQKSSRDAAPSRSKTASSLEESRKQQEELDQYIPNIFHYPTERQLYDLFAGAWDLESQDRMLRQSQQLRDLKIRRDDELLKEEESAKLGSRLFALSIIQVGGAIAAIFALMESDRVWLWPIVSGIIVSSAAVVFGFLFLLWPYLRSRPAYQSVIRGIRRSDQSTSGETGNLP
jgi:hypothetical protein